MCNYNSNDNNEEEKEDIVEVFIIFLTSFYEILDYLVAKFEQ